MTPRGVKVVALSVVLGSMTVLLSDATYDEVRDHVDVRELDPIRVKGRSQLTPVFELLRVR